MRAASEILEHSILDIALLSQGQVVCLVIQRTNTRCKQKTNANSIKETNSGRPHNSRICIKYTVEKARLRKRNHFCAFLSRNVASAAP